MFSLNISAEKIATDFINAKKEEMKVRARIAALQASVTMYGVTANRDQLENSCDLFEQWLLR